MPSDRIRLINLWYCSTSARGNDEICLSVCEILLQVTVHFRVPPSTDKQFVNQQISREKTKQHSIILNVIVLMYELMIFVLYWRAFRFIFYLLFNCNASVLFLALTKLGNIMILLCFLFLFFFFYFLLSTFLSASVLIQLLMSIDVFTELLNKYI